MADLSAAAFDSSIIVLQHHSKSQSAWFHPCTLAFLSSFHFHFFFEPRHDLAIVFLFMGKKAMGAILDAPIRVGKGAATIFHQIQGTKAEETVEILSVTFLMTREELTFLMGKVLIVIRHFSSQLSASLPNSSMVRDSPLRVGSIPARAIQPPLYHRDAPLTLDRCGASSGAGKKPPARP